MGWAGYFICEMYFPAHPRARGVARAPQTTYAAGGSARNASASSKRASGSSRRSPNSSRSWATPVADGLRVHVELAGDAGHLAGMVEPRAQGRAQPTAGAGAQVVERRQGAGGEVGRERPVAGVQQQGGQVLVGQRRAGRR